DHHADGLAGPRGARPWPLPAWDQGARCGVGGGAAGAACVSRRVELHHSNGSRAEATDGKVVEHDPGGLEVTSVGQRLRRVPAPVGDAGLAVALAVAITIGIRTAP